jgi:hypothetical protein
MPSTAKEYFTSMVEPTVAEFIQSPLILRRGLIAAILLNHMVDHIAQEGFPGTDRHTMNARLVSVRNKLVSICPEFQFIQDVADATKHAKLAIPKDPNGHVREVLSSDRIKDAPGFFEVPFGVFSEASEVFVTLNDGTSRPLLPAVTAVFKACQLLVTTESNLLSPTSPTSHHTN